ncbi:hypothetical protein Bxe_B0813 [Paraburkholderia xenovorans LB400]|uniref:Uncharacterized protein n=1 Tax=Paraburkholderia xenovorans (strain LB400) TaxID=266265 RepID=Q13L98_PARXL|nr:hypothetical protein Bxe_B0813 [Paraburkholderia xenovorans LB400]
MLCGHIRLDTANGAPAVHDARHFTVCHKDDNYPLNRLRKDNGPIYSARHNGQGGPLFSKTLTLRNDLPLPGRVRRQPAAITRSVLVVPPPFIRVLQTSITA